MRLASNFRGKSIETINQQLGPDFYVWADKNLTLDFSGSYTISKKIRTFVELNNLTNFYVGLYMGNNRNRILQENGTQLEDKQVLSSIFFNTYPFPKDAYCTSVQ